MDLRASVKFINKRSPKTSSARKPGLFSCPPCFAGVDAPAASLAGWGRPAPNHKLAKPCISTDRNDNEVSPPPTALISITLVLYGSVSRSRSDCTGNITAGNSEGYASWGGLEGPERCERGSEANGSGKDEVPGRVFLQY